MKQKFLLVLAIVLGILVYNPTTIVKATDSSTAVSQTGWQSIGGSTLIKMVQNILGGLSIMIETTI